MVIVYLVNMGDYVEMNCVWDEWVVENNVLFCVVIEVRFVDLNWKVEIVVIVVVV